MGRQGNRQLPAALKPPMIADHFQNLVMRQQMRR